MIATTSPAPTGVRERKRIATRNAIQRAVLTLALDRGFDGVTVEEISHAAGVSPRSIVSRKNPSHAAYTDFGMGDDAAAFNHVVSLSIGNSASRSCVGVTRAPCQAIAACPSR